MWLKRTSLLHFVCNHLPEMLRQISQHSVGRLACCLVDVSHMVSANSAEEAAWLGMKRRPREAGTTSPRRRWEGGGENEKRRTRIY